MSQTLITDRKMYRCIFKVSFYFRGSLYEINVLLTLFLQIEVSIIMRVFWKLRTIFRNTELDAFRLRFKSKVSGILGCV